MEKKDIKKSKTISAIPMEDRVIISQITKEKETKVILSDEVRKSLQAEDFITGIVIAVGPGNMNVKMQVQIGDTILMQKTHGDVIEIDNQKYILCRQSYIACILKRKPK